MKKQIEIEDIDEVSDEILGFLRHISKVHGNRVSLLGFLAVFCATIHHAISKGTDDFTIGLVNIGLEIDGLKIVKTKEPN